MMSREFKASILDTKTEEWQEYEFLVVEPTLEHQNEASKVYNRTFRDALESGAILRASLSDYMEKQGLWSDEKELEYNQIQEEIRISERKLKKGGMKLSEARAIALSMSEDRNKLRELISERTSLDSNTAEGQADNERFNYLVSCCVVYKDNKKRFFKNFAHFKNNNAIGVALKGAQILANMMYNLDDNFEKTLPENEFLVKYKLADENLRLIDKQGRFVTKEGKLVDEFGFYIDGDGNRVDVDGNPVTEVGEPDEKFTPFVDDETGTLFDEHGNPIEDKPKPKRRTRKKAQPKDETSEVEALADD
jgi:hypothetical protein